MKNNVNNKISLILVLLSLNACKTSKIDDDKIIPSEDLYQKALISYQKGNYKEAAEDFGKIYFQHPGGSITPFAELMEAYNLYQAREYEDSIVVLDNFIHLHPTHVDTSYAFYLKALCYYMQISDVNHDQNITERAKKAFEVVINRYPGTKYAIDSALKIDLVNEHLAGKEMQIGRYYLLNNNPIGAINRFQTIIDNFQMTSHAPESLFRLVESCLILGIRDEAVKYASVLAYNYPESIWFSKAEHILKN